MPKTAEKKPLRPAQVQKQKPGREYKMRPRPRVKPPQYKGADKLRGKVALITGGDSGIGRAVAVLYAREGADVALTALPQEHVDAEETRAAVEGEGRKCLIIEGDLAAPEFARTCVERTVKELGHLDVLVHNAAHQNHWKTVEEVPDEEWD